ncbi:hypothetical protein LEP1GSC041_2893 [Leptospira noguchii str. 2006001870]|nr:hypothetical protein LEP1GSC041_2893 [Leptospira noguchii str. 2006001870]
MDTLMDGRFRLQEKFDIVDIKFNKLNLWNYCILFCMQFMNNNIK